ncbi:hypothetical protein ASPZODRAFT_62028 [Penicilliopsis zonata CBS 506.65]|uniref:Amino acid permease/ SLC12A domain-containing protein n=1 Tax=Penicilliopsis zonata CBS 506.65 TaxID=1073090 RepID=A0A1L9SND5_9EURO|nr:hypothetical protein ASPZODRAFT_62028 [Penicilliopsis zonata CBS 506.65]OJJ48710.1 hypothetical protein ASPZODRAFT_62028 [Penicilliopsis zonata CBS 506.65]
MSAHESKVVNETTRSVLEARACDPVGDDEVLARLGKRPVLKRKFDFMALLGLTCTILSTWEGMLVMFVEPLLNGGPAGVVYSYIVAWIGTTATFITFAEMVSMAPTSGGQYHWAMMLAPRSSFRFTGFLAGYLTTFGWQASVAAVGYMMGNMIQGLIVLTHPTYEPQAWHLTLLMFLTLACAAFVNVAASGLLPKVERLALVLHILGFFAILIPLVYLGEHNSAQFVFTSFLNGGHFETQGLSFMVGMTGSMFAFTGADAAFHMAEEINNAAVVIPRSIFASVLLNGILGFGMVIAALFATTDVNSALQTKTGYPFIAILQQATGSVAGSAAMTSLILVLGLGGFVGAVASSSRMIWSFARDRGLPGWALLQRVDTRTSIPVVAVGVTTLVACLLGLITLGSPTVFNDMISLSLSSLFLSYLISMCLLLWRRCTGRIRSLCSLSTTEPVYNTPGAPLVWGPFYLDGFWGILVNVFSIIYLVVGVFFSFWPPSASVDGPTMNYSVVGTGGVVILSTLYYLVIAKREFRGAVVE